jgi:hypothetical protein
MTGFLEFKKLLAEGQTVSCNVHNISPIMISQQIRTGHGMFYAFYPWLFQSECRSNESSKLPVPVLRTTVGSRLYTSNVRHCLQSGSISYKQADFEHEVFLYQRRGGGSTMPKSSEHIIEATSIAKHSQNSC